MDLDRAAMSRMLEGMLAESSADAQARESRRLAEISDHYMSWPERSPAPPPAQVSNYGVSTFDHSVLPRSSMVEDRRWDRRADRAADLRAAIRERGDMAEHAEFSRRGEPWSPVLDPGDATEMGPAQDGDDRWGFAAGGATPFPSDDDPEAALRQMASEIPEPPRQPSTLDRLAQTWPARLASDAWSAATLPRDVAAGRVSHADLYEPDSQLQERMLGLGAIPMVATTGAPRGALGAGLVRPDRPPPQGPPRPGPPRASENFPAPVAEPIRAYHGSPHDFDRFRMSAMGTGEGAQVYGPGLYFAEREGTAQSYRDALGKTLFGGREYDPSDVAHRVANAFRDQGGRAANMSRDDYMQMLEGILARPDTRTYRSSIDQANVAQGRLWAQESLDYLRRGGEPAPITQGGRMYEVDIHARPDQVLDFDRGMFAQPAGIQQTMRAMPRVQERMDAALADQQRAKSLRAFLADVRADPTAYSGYTARELRELERRLVDMEEGPRAESIIREMRSMRPDRYLDEMRDMGVLATRYLDQGSRGLAPTDPRRSSNYVVHDDRMVDILRKYGLAGAAAVPVAGAYLGSDARGD